MKLGSSYHTSNYDWDILFVNYAEYIKSKYYDGNKWMPANIITLPNMYASDWSTKLDSSNNPKVIWNDIWERGLFWTYFENDKWEKPKLIPAHNYKTISNFSCCIDKKDNIHIVYTSRMIPPEHYSRGFIVVEGQSPSKYFHQIYNGNTWSKPKSTTGRGRFGIDQPVLSVSPSGKIYLSTTYMPYPKSVGDLRPYVTYQEYHNNIWSNYKRISPPGIYSNNIYLVVDSKEILHSIWDEDIVKLKYGRVENINTTGIRLIDKESAYVSMAKDSKDRIYICNHYCPVISQITIIGYVNGSLKSCSNPQKTGFLREFSRKALPLKLAEFRTYWLPDRVPFLGWLPRHKR